MTKHNDHRRLESLEVYAGDAALSSGIQRVTGTELMRIVLFKRVMHTMHFYVSFILMLLLCLAFEAGFVTDTFEIRKDPVQDVLTLDGKVDCACTCDESMFTFLCSVLLHSKKRVRGT